MGQLGDNAKEDKLLQKWKQSSVKHHGNKKHAIFIKHKQKQRSSLPTFKGNLMNCTCIRSVQIQTPSNQNTCIYIINISKQNHISSQIRNIKWKAVV